MTGAQTSTGRQADAWGTALAVLVVTPWLWAFTPGPTANAGPMFASWACLLLSLLILCVRPPQAGLGPVLLRAWLVAASVSAVIGLAQWFGFASLLPGASAADIGEAYGNLRQRNQFATLLSIGLVALVWRPPAHSAVRYGTVLLLAAANAASASRTGGVQWVVIALLAVAWPGDRRTRACLGTAALAGYAASLALLPQALMAWRGIDPATAFSRAFSELGCSSRKVLWSNVAHLIAQRPWTGWGLGELDYAHYATLYPADRFCDILDNAHNLPLHIAVEAGVPAALAAMALLLFAVWRGRPWREHDADRQAAWAVLAMIGLHSLLEYPLWYGPFEAAAVYAVLLLVQPHVAAPPRSIVVAGCAAGLAMVVYASAEYAKVAQAYKTPSERWTAYREDPIRAAGRVIVFRSQLDFAELSITDVDARTAPRVHELALAMLHYSPEPMVIEKLIDSARRLGKAEEARWHAERYRAAFPEQYSRWRESSMQRAGDPPPILGNR